MNSRAPISSSLTRSKTFFKASAIATAMGKDRGIVRRLARRGRWRVQRYGNRVAYRVPQGLRARCVEISPGPSLFERPEIILGLKRAAAVLGFILEMERDRKLGVERALALTVSRYQRFMRCSMRALRRWVRAVERDGIGALIDGRRGRSGRRSAFLHTLLRSYGRLR